MAPPTEPRRPSVSTPPPGIVVATLDDIGTSERLDLQDSGAQLSTGHGPETPAFLYGSSRLAEALLGAPLSTLKPGTEG